MIITRTPLRVSFLGGGSDYPTYFANEAGAVFGTAINRYVYVTVIRHSTIVDKQFKLTYRDNEAVDRPIDFKHPVVRAVFEDAEWTGPGFHIATITELPSNTGLGSSSAFTVALLHALALFEGRTVTPESLARDAIRVERDTLKEAGGWQDQFHAAYGGSALYEFSASGVTRRCLETAAPDTGLNRSMVLVPTGKQRGSHGFAAATTVAVGTDAGARAARAMADLARETFSALQGVAEPSLAVETLARSMHTAWDLKRRILGGVLDPDVDMIIDRGMANGALAGRLCGAGGSGFVLFLTHPDDRTAFLARSGFLVAEEVEVSENGSVHGPAEWM